MSKAYIWTPKQKGNKKYKHIAKKLWHKETRLQGKALCKLMELPITVELDY